MLEVTRHMSDAVFTATERAFQKLLDTQRDPVRYSRMRAIKEASEMLSHALDSLIRLRKEALSRQASGAPPTNWYGSTMAIIFGTADVPQKDAPLGSTVTLTSSSTPASATESTHG